jgi:hypothetical protein
MATGEALNLPLSFAELDNGKPPEEWQGRHLVRAPLSVMREGMEFVTDSDFGLPCPFSRRGHCSCFLYACFRC